MLRYRLSMLLHRLAYFIFTPDVTKITKKKVCPLGTRYIDANGLPYLYVRRK